MATSRLISLAVSGGAGVNIAATIMARRVSMVEDASANAGVKQGLIFQWLKDGFVNNYQVAAGDEPVVIQNDLVQGMGRSPILATTAQGQAGAFNAVTGGYYFKGVTSSSASTTKVRVVEDE